jgi:hypothetical protein
MARSTALAVTLLFASSFASSCALELSAEPGCESDLECARGEVCRAGSCARGIGSNPLDLDGDDDEEAFELAGCTLRERGGVEYLFCAQPSTYFVGRDKCASVGAHLLDVHDNGSVALDKLEESEVLDLAPGVSRLWLDFDDRAVEGTFVTSGGATLDLAESLRAGRFVAGEPNDGLQVGEDCVEIEPAGSWNDTGCDGPAAPVCRGVALNADVPADCSFATVNGASLLFCATGRTAAASAALCAASGGRLLDFAGKTRDVVLAESTAVRERATALGFAELWLGLNDLSRESFFLWSDGSALDRAAALFRAGEPNNDGGIENCLELTPAGWNDCDCALTLPFFCER